MFIIGECIHVISKDVRKAIEERNKPFIQELARRQVEQGANILDLNIGPQKKAGAEVMPWMVNAIQEVTDVQLSLDTTNATAMEAGIQACKKKPIINSTDATPERLNALMPLAAKYKTQIIALTLASGGLPTSADMRIQLASENIFPSSAQYGVETPNILLDPLVLTVNGNQDQALQTVEATRFFKQMADPPPLTTCGLSNISNSCPPEVRPMLNRVFLVMMMGAGLDTVIADPFDADLMAAVRILERRDDSTPKGRLYLSIFDAYQSGVEFDPSGVNMSDMELSSIVKTERVLANKTLYAHSYAKL